MGISGDRADDLAATLVGYPRVDAQRLEGLALLHRVETKFLLPDTAIPPLLEALSADYGLPPDHPRAPTSYHNQYFDTPERAFYLQHHRGQRPRYKVRIRHYLDRSVSALEIKRKTNRDVTHKTIHPHTFALNELQEAARAFLAEHTAVDSAALVPQVKSRFSRITLLGLAAPERITIDVDLAFEGHGRDQALPGLAIFEVKQARFSPRSPAMLILRERGLRPTRISKYCTAQVQLDPSIRHNRFRGQLRAIRRITHARVVGRQ